MKTSQKDDLPGLLRLWQVSPAPSSRFSTDVWRQIEATRSGETWPGFARGHAALMAVLMTVAALGGGWGGVQTAQVRVEAGSTAMADAYVQSMDARQMTIP